MATRKAKEKPGELLAKKKELSDLKEKRLKDSKAHEIAMRQKACLVGNIVGKNVPVSMTEVNLCAP